VDAEKLAGLLREVAESRHLALLGLRGCDRPCPLSGKEDLITSVSVHDGLVRVECQCRHGQPDWLVIDPAEVATVRWVGREHAQEHDDDEPRGNIL
jgi:hypothetical protein